MIESLQRQPAHQESITRSFGEQIPISTMGTQDSTEYATLLHDILVHGEAKLFDATTTYDGWQLLSSAQLSLPRIAELLASAGGNISTAITSDGKNLLHWSAMHGKPEMIDLLLAYNIDIDSSTDDGRTPLHFAAMCGRSHVVEQLIEHGAAVNAVSKEGLTPLYYAIRSRSHATINLLLSHGVDINAPISQGLNLLHRAARDGMWGVIDLMLQHGADINLPSADGHTALWYAALNGHTPVVELLLKRGAEGRDIPEKARPVDMEKRGWFPLWVDQLFYPNRPPAILHNDVYLYLSALVFIITLIVIIRGCSAGG